MNFKKIITVAAGCLVYSPRKRCFLFIKMKDEDVLEIPKGSYEKKDKTVVRTAIRETLEETNVRCFVIEKLGNAVRKKEEGLKKTVFFLGVDVSGKARSQKNEGIDKTVWVSMKKLEKSTKTIRCYQRTFVKRAIKLVKERM